MDLIKNTIMKLIPFTNIPFLWLNSKKWYRKFRGGIWNKYLIINDLDISQYPKITGEFWVRNEVWIDTSGQNQIRLFLTENYN